LSGGAPPRFWATAFCYSRGGAGGIFVPALFIGGMLGGAFGYADVALFHHAPSEIGAFALVGMGVVFAGIIRAPITSLAAWYVRLMPETARAAQASSQT
jgi:H+/Cl- antiporter ClcA